MQLRHLALVVFSLLTSICYGQEITPSPSYNRDPITKSYNRIFASYEHGFLKTKYISDLDHTNGFAIGYTHGFSLSKTTPVFIEAGVTGHFGFARESNANMVVFDVNNLYQIFEHPENLTLYPATLKQSGDCFSFSIPISIAYKFKINNNISIEPFIGTSARVNLLCDINQSISANNPSDQRKVDLLLTNDFNNMCGTWPFYTAFDKDKLGEGGAWRHFQWGIHGGVNAQIHAISLGIAYNFNLLKLSGTTRSSFLNVSVGYNFCVY